MQAGKHAGTQAGRRDGEQAGRQGNPAPLPGPPTFCVVLHPLHSYRQLELHALAVRPHAAVALHLAERCGGDLVLGAGQGRAGLGWAQDGGR